MAPDRSNDPTARNTEARSPREYISPSAHAALERRCNEQTHLLEEQARTLAELRAQLIERDAQIEALQRKVDGSGSTGTLGQWSIVAEPGGTLPGNGDALFYKLGDAPPHPFYPTREHLANCAACQAVDRELQLKHIGERVARNVLEDGAEGAALQVILASPPCHGFASRTAAPRQAHPSLVDAAVVEYLEHAQGAEPMPQTERAHMHAAQLGARAYVSPHLRAAAGILRAQGEADAAADLEGIAAIVDGALDGFLVRSLRAAIRFIEGGPSAAGNT